MCQYIDPASFMSGVFVVCPDQKEFTFSDLRRVRDHVSGALAARNVIIEWTRNAVMGAIECYPDLFENATNGVAWRSEADRGAIRECFGSAYPRGFADEFLSAVAEGVGKTRAPVA